MSVARGAMERYRAGRMARLARFGRFASIAVVAAAGVARAAADDRNAAVPAAHDVAPAVFRALSTGHAVERSAALRSALRAVLAPDAPAWDADCEADRETTGGVPGVVRHALADGSWLIEVGCAMGAYQGSFWAAQLWRDAGSAGAATAGKAALVVWPVAVERAATTPMSAAAPAAPESAAAPAAPGIAIEAQVVAWGELEAVAPSRAGRAEVEIVNRFRAAGDCGTRSRYALQAGRAELVALAAAVVCPDTVQPGGAWPPVALPIR